MSAPRREWVKGKVMGEADYRALQQAWFEYQEALRNGNHANGTHVGTLEAMEMLREASGQKTDARRLPPLPPEKEEQGRFFDWLLHTKKDKILAYQLLRKVGTLIVGPREYWATTQGDRRAIAWESRFSYPGTDSEIWNVELVD